MKDDGTNQRPPQYGETVPDLRALSPNARALWWYMVATSSEQEIAAIAERSGIPLSSIYAVASRYPHVFRLTGSLVRHVAAERHPSVTQHATRA